MIDKRQSRRWQLPAFLHVNVNYDQRIWGLDLVRAIAVLQVIYIHGAMLILSKADIEAPSSFYIDGVQIFFVLSGFLIGGILLHEIEREDWGIKRLFRFLTRRWLRTLPLYFLILILNVFVVYFGIIKEDIHKFSISYFTFTYNLFHRNIGFFWEAWSLSIEEWFYILFALSLFVLVLARYSVGTKKTLILLCVTLFLIISACIRRFSSFDPSDQDFTHAIIYRIDSPVYGILGAFAFRYFSGMWVRMRLLFFITGILLITHSHTGFMLIDSTFYGALMSIGILFTFPLFHHFKLNLTWFGKAITHISLISYSAYLINLALTAEIIVSNISATSARAIWFLYALYWFLVIFNSTLLYKYFEKPIMERRPKA